MSLKDPDARREYLRQWYRRNTARWKQHAQSWRKANRERMLASLREYYLANREELLAAGSLYYAANRDQHYASTRAWARRNAERFGDFRRKERLMKKFGLTLVSFKERVAAQQGLCAICRQSPGKRTLDVDHDHRTGQIRNLLCRRCNFVLGAVKENRWVLKRMVAYLEEHREDDAPLTFAAA